MITLISITVIAIAILFAMKKRFKGLSQLTESSKIHLIILSLFNLIIIGILVSMVLDGNDKSIILLILGYPALTFLNGIIWLILAILKRPEYKIYQTTTIWLCILFIPTLIASSMY
jgi:hypothetical protein